MNDVCVFFGEGYEEIEALTVVDILRRASCEDGVHHGGTGSDGFSSDHGEDGLSVVGSGL